jgi:hypothetical protein
MDNRKDDTTTVPTDRGEDSGERQRTASEGWKQGQQQWDDRQGIPRGTQEQGKQAPDRVGGSGMTQAEPEIDDDDPAQLERDGKRDELENQDEKRQAAAEDHESDRGSGQGSPSRKI